MATKKDIINDKTYIMVHKNMVGSLSYLFDGRERYWEDTAEYKNLEAREIKDIMATSGGRRLFDENCLIIKDATHRGYFGLDELSGDVLDSSKIKDVLFSGDINKIEDTVSTCTDNELELVVDVAIKEKLQDRNAIKVVEDYSGLELTEDLTEIVKTDKPAEKTAKGKVKREKVTK